MGYLFRQKRRKVGRLQRQAARCFLVTQEVSSVELGTWCWPRVVLIEKRPLRRCSKRRVDQPRRPIYPGHHLVTYGGDPITSGQGTPSRQTCWLLSGPGRV